MKHVEGPGVMWLDLSSIVRKPLVVVAVHVVEAHTFLLVYFAGSMRGSKEGSRQLGNAGWMMYDVYFLILCTRRDRRGISLFSRGLISV